MHDNPILNHLLKEETIEKFYLIRKRKVFYDNKECQLLVFRDVTTHRLLEEERSKLKLMKLLHASVSHDLLNPLGNLEVFAE